MSLICKDCGGIFNRHCITFNNTNDPHIMNNNHYQIDKYGILFPVYSNFLGIECWLNDNYDNSNYGIFTYQPTIKLLKKLQTLSQKTGVDIQIFKEITKFLDQKYVINLDYGFNLLNHQLTTNSINLQGHSTIFIGNILNWVQPILNPILNYNYQQPILNYNYQQYYEQPFQQFYYQNDFIPKYNHNNSKSNLKKKTKTSKVLFKLLLPTINE